MRYGEGNGGGADEALCFSCLSSHVTEPSSTILFFSSLLPRSNFRRCRIHSCNGPWSLVCELWHSGQTTCVICYDYLINNRIKKTQINRCTHIDIYAFTRDMRDAMDAWLVPWCCPCTPRRRRYRRPPSYNTPPTAIIYWI